MTFPIIGAVVLFSGLIALILGWSLRQSEQQKSDVWFAKMVRGDKRLNRNLGKLERVTRLEVIKAVLRGERCRGCSKIVDNDLMGVVGEDARQREIRMCRDCRVLMGLEDET